MIYITAFSIDFKVKYMPTYKISAAKLGKNCGFVAESATAEEAVKKAIDHAKTCSICSGLSEEQAKSAIEQVDRAAPSA